MFCKNCGSWVEDGVRFCTRCGASMGIPQTGAGQSDASSPAKPVTPPSGKTVSGGFGTPLTPSGFGTPPAAGGFGTPLASEGSSTPPPSVPPGTPPTTPPPPATPTGKNKKRRPKKKRRLLRLLVLVALAFVVFRVLNRLGIIGKKEETLEVVLTGEVLDDTDYRVEPPDADAYFEENAEVLSVVAVEHSEDLQTGGEAKNTFIERGFGDYPVTAEYSVTGRLEEETEVDESTTGQYPMYQSLYYAANGDVWVIYSVNGAIMANPVTYNIESGLGTQVLISESETVMSFDSTTYKFYETVPNESELIVKTVDRIDAGVLDSLTAEVIDAL